MSRDTNFYYSFLVLPADKRRAIIAVWDFCRAVDDAVDDPGAAEGPAGGPRGELARWRGELAACYEGQPPATGQGRRLRPWIERFKLPRAAFEHVIDGVEMDLGTPRFATFDDLYQYCYRVASAVGLICIEIFGYRNPRARDYAVELGVALQLTNILRDVPADLARGRLYLPLEDLDRFGCTEADLRAARLTPPVRALLRHQAARAREYYRRARAALPPEDARRLVAAKIMAAIYFAILRRIERAGCDVFSATHRLPRPRRAWIAVTTWAGTMITGGRRVR
jgi:15-cis-phytoene synthase